MTDDGAQPPGAKPPANDLERPVADNDLEDLISDLHWSARSNARGRPASPIYHEYSRDLTEADIVALDTLPWGAKGSKPKSLVRIHASHHSLARCLASGMRPAQAALVTGYSSHRISMLQHDAAFEALVADYRAEIKDTFADMAERMSNLSLDALEILQERLHDAPESFNTSTLLDVIKTFADRTGHGPNQEVSLKVSTDFVDRPPRETFEEWTTRRTRELGAEEPKKIN
jgi:hypothetical protein